MTAPANKSTSKVRVTRLFGTSSTVGLMDPVLNMKVRRGIDDRWIVGLDSGNYQVSLSQTFQGPTVAKAYPHELEIDAPQASGFGWPASSTSVTFGHAGAFPNGVPNIPGSGMYFQGGDGNVVAFSRSGSEV